jgi:hypothetical protein
MSDATLLRELQDPTVPPARKRAVFARHVKAAAAVWRAASDRRDEEVDRFQLIAAEWLGRAVGPGHGSVLDERRAVRRAMQMLLSERRRTVIRGILSRAELHVCRLRFLDRLSVSDIATREGVPDRTVRRAIARLWGIANTCAGPDRGVRAVRPDEPVAVVSY